MVLEELGLDIQVLKRTKICQLEPGLQQELFELAASLSGETTLTGRSSIYAFYRMYEAERTKERKNRKLLKRAEETILRLAGLQTLHHEIQQREDTRRREERKRKIPLALIQGGMTSSKRMQELFESIGITDKSEIERCVGLLGEPKSEERIELVKSINVGLDVLKKLFNAHPETLRMPKEEDFVSEIDAIEGKKATLDNWKDINQKPLPLWADYEQSPGILLDDYRTISDLLNIKIPPEPAEEETKEKKKIKYRSRPMSTREMDATLTQLGFEMVRQRAEAVFRKTILDDKGAKKVLTLTMNRPHGREYVPETIRCIIREAGVTPSEFEEARKKARGEL